MTAADDETNRDESRGLDDSMTRSDEAVTTGPEASADSGSGGGSGGSGGGSSGTAFALDAVLVAGYALVAGATLYTGAVDGPTRLLVAAPLLGFLPGYALVSALFPARDGGEDGLLTTARLRRPGIAWVERCAFSVATTLAVLPMLVLAMAGLGVPLTTQSFTVALVAVVVAGAIVGVARRFRLAPAERYALPVGRWRRDLHAGVLGTESPVDATLNVLLAVAVVLAMSGLAYGLAAPQRGESYTEAALLTQQGDELVAGNYTTTIVQGSPANVTLTVENQEGGAVNYTAVVVVERLRTTGENPVVLERRELQRVSFRVRDGRTHAEQLSLEPQLLGENLRLSVLVFHGDAPEVATPTKADEHLYLWVDVRATERNVGVVASPPLPDRSPSGVAPGGR